jgi:hypothetical protein
MALPGHAERTTSRPQQPSLTVRHICDSTSQLALDIPQTRWKPSADSKRIVSCRVAAAPDQEADLSVPLAPRVGPFARLVATSALPLTKGARSGWLQLLLPPRRVDQTELDSQTL